MKFSLFKKLVEEEFEQDVQELRGYTEYNTKPLYVCLAQRDNIRDLYYNNVITKKQAKTFNNNVTKNAYSIYTKNPEKYEELMSQYYFNSKGEIRCISDD